MRTAGFQPMRLFDGYAIAVVAAALCLAGCSRNPGTENSREAVTNTGKPELATAFSLEQFMVAVTNTSHTLIGFNHTSPPPWPRGNYLTFHFRKSSAPGAMEEWVRWSAVNIHAENYFEITRRLGIEAVEVRVLSTMRETNKVRESGREERSVIEARGYALVTDPRIPRDWFLSWPDSRWGNVDGGTRNKCRVAHPGIFRASD